MGSRVVLQGTVATYVQSVQVEVIPKRFACEQTRNVPPMRQAMVDN